MELKGQMVDCWESQCLLFLGSPLIDGLEGLTTRGLYISDIPIHDATRDVILVGEQSRAQVIAKKFPLFINVNHKQNMSFCYIHRHLSLRPS